MVWAVVILYSLCLLYIFLFSLGQLHLALIYLRIKKNTPAPNPQNDFFPLVTVQLPIYNEKYVVERVLDAVAQFDYPKEKLWIQVLDDSTDETTAMIKSKVTELSARGLRIEMIHRSDRTGFKAGALENGLESTASEFIAIFDADFIPKPDFLKKTLFHFLDPEIGAVQTRWEHLNKDYSLLTRLQAFGLDAHFSIEQCARSAAGSFINFNGTCGIWRRACIESAGGWSADTLTEDLDLSYRAQLKGWKFKYLEDVETPGELPVIMSAIKSQQYRWNKGAAETARKNFGRVMRSNMGWSNKVHAFLHLFNSSVFVGILLASLLSVPMLFIKQSHPEFQGLFDAGAFLFAGFFSISLFYWVSTKRFYSNPAKSFFFLFPRFLIVSMGLSLHNGLAVLGGLFGRKTPFVRTPKFNVIGKSDSWTGNIYVRTRISLESWMEALMAAYFVFGVMLAFLFKDGSLIFFHVLLTLGFGSVFYFSVKPALHA